MMHFRKLQAHEISRQHGPWIDEVQPNFGVEIGERFAWARTITDAEAEAAGTAREAFTRRVTGLLGDNGIICLPATSDIAPLTTTSAETLVEHRNRTLSLTCIAGLARLPQVSLPLAQVDGCPLALGLIGPPDSDRRLLAFAEAFVGQADAMPPEPYSL